MQRRNAVRWVFAGIAIVLFAWWADADHHLLNLLDRLGAPNLIYDFANFVLGYSITTLVGGAVALWGAYRWFTAPRA